MIDPCADCDAYDVTIPDLTAERDTLAGQVATLRAWIATECMPDAEWACEGHNWNMSEEDRERGQALLADTAAAAATHDDRMRAEGARIERERITAAVHAQYAAMPFDIAADDEKWCLSEAVIFAAIEAPRLGFPRGDRHSSSCDHDPDLRAALASVEAGT
jgi:hypothetical protein